MNKKFEKELIKLAKKYNMEYFSECQYCERHEIEAGTGNSYVVTFSEKEMVDK